MAYCSFKSQELALLRPLKLSNLKGFHSLINRAHKGFVPGHYKRPYSTLNVSYIDNHIYDTPKQFVRIVLVSQSIVLQFLKEVYT